MGLATLPAEFPIGKADHDSRCPSGGRMCCASPPAYRPCLPPDSNSSAISGPPKHSALRIRPACWPSPDETIDWAAKAKAWMRLQHRVIRRGATVSEESTRPAGPAQSGAFSLIRDAQQGCRAHFPDCPAHSRSEHRRTSVKDVVPCIVRTTKHIWWHPRHARRTTDELIHKGSFGMSEKVILARHDRRPGTVGLQS